MSEPTPRVLARGVAYPVSLGATLTGSPGSAPRDAYASFKYDWKVPGIDPSKPGRVRRDPSSGTRVTVAFQNVVEGEREINYRGTYHPLNRDVDPSAEASAGSSSGVECALVFDAAAGTSELERLDGAVKSLRVARDEDAGMISSGTAPGVGVGDLTSPKPPGPASQRRRPAQARDGGARRMEAAAEAVAQRSPPARRLRPIIASRSARVARFEDEAENASLRAGVTAAVCSHTHRLSRRTCGSAAPLGSVRGVARAPLRGFS